MLNAALRICVWVMAADVAVQAAAPLPSLAELRAARPELLVAGASHVLIDTDPQGYAVCAAVERYFDEETAAELSRELDLVARRQLLRHIASGWMDGDTQPAGPWSLSLKGLVRHATWWEGDSLFGLYFVPVDGVERTPATPRPSSPGTPSGPTAEERLIDGRELRLRGDLGAAKEVFERLRTDCPLSPEARRALREIYLVNAAEKERRGKRAGARP